MFTVLISRSSFFVCWYDSGLVGKKYVFQCDSDSQNLVEVRGKENRRPHI
jgi:hypothetical protein